MAATRKSEIEDSKITIIHTMADGTVKDTVYGIEIPYNDTTAYVYRLLAKWVAKKRMAT